MKLRLITFFLFCSAVGHTQPDRLPDGGGEFISEQSQCITPLERAEINNILEENVARLKSEGYFTESADRMVVSFNWPLRKITSLDYNSYYAINNYVDQNTSSGSIQDYNCGARTYDGHNGTDIDTWPFPWMLVANNAVEVIAAEAGTIIGKFDGNLDDHCACSGNWNAIYVQHSDGSVAWYGHMKMNSLTTKTVGQTVAKGEFLGVVASSGCSTQPHLHFEVYKALPYQPSNLIDPFQGSCNILNPQTWWAVQKPYREPTLNANLTHNAVPVHGCPGSMEVPNISNTFSAGSTVYVANYYHDQLVNHVTSMQILKPDNSVWQSWSHTSPSTYTKSWWYWTWILPTTGPNGTWKYIVTYQGQTYTHLFTVTGALPVTLESFSGSLESDNSVLLKWRISNAINHDYFEIERSIDGIEFQPIGMVINTPENGIFEYQDKKTPDPTAYYRLRQVDKDDKFTYSPVISVNAKDANKFSIYPNPVSQKLNIAGSINKIDHLNIYDIDGRLVLQESEPGGEVEISDLNNGIYRVEIYCNGNITNLSMMKINHD